jgi:carbon starvation protein CstA
MTEQRREPRDEISDLKQALESFKKEKEQVRQILGKIGGIPSFHTKLINAVFIVVIVASGIVSVVSEDLRLLMVELTTVMLSVKIIYLMHCQMRVNHFKFWILSAIEWRISEMMVEIKQLKKDFAQKKEA